MPRTPSTLLAILFVAFCAAPFAASANSYDPGSVGATLEVHMSENGAVNVKGARVRSVTESGFIAETLWGAGKLTWTVRTNENTPITRKNGGRIDLHTVTAGDYVSFTGNIQSSLPPFTVDANTVRDWSVGENHTVLSGTVSTIDTDAGTFTLTTGKGGVITVATTGSTTYAQNGARSFSDISEGDTVIAFGTQNGKTIAATKLNLQERLVTSAQVRPVIATGLGSWVDSFLPRFFAGRFN